MSTVSLPPSFPYQIDRTVMIHATPETVFRFFTDSARWAKWWGAGSTIDATPGGRVYIKHPGDVESAGEVLEVRSPRRLVFTYGFVSGKPYPAGASRVTIDLEADRAGTRLSLKHELADKASQVEHVQGWRFQLSLFANAVANEVAFGAASAIDTWFEAWVEPDLEKREKQLGSVVSPEIRFQDAYSNLDGLDDLMPHITASQHFMPGMRMRRMGEPRHCQGMVLSEWAVTGADGQQKARGTNVFVLGPTGKIEWVTGFWSPPAT
jgi:uncharacterized protein YndB with AHSA1/START domain